MRKPINHSIYNNTSIFSWKTGGTTTPFTSTTRDPRTPEQTPSPGQEQRPPEYRSHPAYNPTAFVPDWVFDNLEDSSTSDLQWPYSPESDDDSKYESILSQEPYPLPPSHSASGQDFDALNQTRSQQPPFQSQSHRHLGQEYPRQQHGGGYNVAFQMSQNRDRGNYDQAQCGSSNNNNNAISVPYNNYFDSNSNSNQAGSVNRPCDLDPTQSRQRRMRQVPPVQLINNVHPDRWAMILQELRAQAAPPPPPPSPPPPPPVPAERPTQKTSSVPRLLLPKKQTLTLASQPPSQATPTPPRKPRKKTPTALAAKKSPKSTPSVPAPSSKEAALAFELLLEVAMIPGNSGRGSRSILREQRKRLIAAGLEVPQEVSSILEDDSLSASSEMDINDDDQDHTASAPIDLTPFSVRKGDSVDKNSTPGIATVSTLVQHSEPDHTGSSARFSMKQERCQPCTDVRVSCPEGGGQQRSVRKGEAWAKSSVDQLRSALPSCMGSSSLPPPLLPTLEGYKASSTNTMTSVTLAREKVGSDLTADSPFRARDEVLRRRKAETDSIIEYLKGSHGRAGNRD
ncbi:hypothetical protein BGZ88_001206 [Linnemannia elongata]|nr:hypothetical protein BGZ88_001206 [Linnemannia elongata]